MNSLSELLYLCTMCYSIKPVTKIAKLAEHKNLKPIKGRVEDYYTPKDLISGFEFPFVPVTTNDDKTQLRLAKWWLMRPDQKLETRTSLNTLNTRCENITKEGSNCYTYQENKAIMYVEGFYEYHWNDNKGKSKTKYLMTPVEGNTFPLACIYSNWYHPDLEREIKTVSILTREANIPLAKIHNKAKRMPVVLDKHTASEWMDGNINIPDFVQMNAFFEGLEMHYLEV